MGDVRYVCHTHLHIDHAGKDDLFPMNTTVVVNRRELEYSVSGLMHPQYPAPDIKHLIDRLHTKSALRFLDLEITGPVELIPGVYCEAAGAHTEGSMNIHVHTAEGIATICGDVLYDINDQIVEPFREIHDAEPRTTGNHGTSKRAEKAAIKKLVKFALPAAGPRPARQDRGRPGRRPAAGPGARSDRAVAAQAATGSRPEPRRGSPMTHATLRPEFEDLIDPTRRSASSARASPSPRGRSGIRSITICCSRTCRPTCAGAGTPRAASSRSSARPTNATA